MLKKNIIIIINYITDKSEIYMEDLLEESKREYIYTYRYNIKKERLKQIHVKVDEKLSGIDVWIESWVCKSVAYLYKSVAHLLYTNVAYQNMCHSVA